MPERTPVSGLIPRARELRQNQARADLTLPAPEGMVRPNPLASVSEADVVAGFENVTKANANDIVTGAEQLLTESQPHLGYSLRSMLARKRAQRRQLAIDPTPIRELAAEGNIFAQRVLAERQQTYVGKHRPESVAAEVSAEFTHAGLSGYALGVTETTRPAVRRWRRRPQSELIKEQQLRHMKEIGAHLRKIGVSPEEAARFIKPVAEGQQDFPTTINDMHDVVMHVVSKLQLISTLDDLVKRTTIKPLTPVPTPL